MNVMKVMKVMKVMNDRRSKRENGKIGPETTLQEEPRNDGRSGRDIRSNRIATTA
jgi:hypothetical protein